MRILLFACTALIFAFSLWTKPASANTSLTFSVKPNFPANQVSSTKGYYHFTIKPDESYELSFVMTNTTTKKQTVYITPMNGLSSPSGGTQYIDKLETPNSWLLDGKMAVASLIDIQNSVTLKPHESKTVSFTVKSPAKVSSGTLLGGLHFSTNETTSTQKQEDEKKRRIICD